MAGPFYQDRAELRQAYYAHWRHVRPLEFCRRRMRDGLSTLHLNREIPAVRSPATGGCQDAIRRPSRHRHGEVLIGVCLRSDAVVGEYDGAAGIDAAGDDI